MFGKLKMLLNKLLIENAIKFSHNTETPVVKVFFEDLGNNYQITGLGLSLVRKIVETHKGTIEVSSEGKNKGASFYIFYLRNMSNYITVQSYKSPVGELLVGVYEDKLCLCDWKYRKTRGQVDERITSKLNAVYQEGDHPLIEETIIELKEYFVGKRQEFDLPLLMLGTDFQQQVWKQLIQIPYGKTQSYLALSQQLGNEKAIRAVAAANGANAISIIVPCHRIIGANGDLIGYVGGLPAKKELLKVEGCDVGHGQLSLF